MNTTVIINLLYAQESMLPKLECSEKLCLKKLLRFLAIFFVLNIFFLLCKTLHVAFPLGIKHLT